MSELYLKAAVAGQGQLTNHQPASGRFWQLLLELHPHQVVQLQTDSIH